MIIIKLQGGLGNQMFQYSLGRIIAEKYNLSLFIDPGFFLLKEKSRGHTPRSFELSIFDNSYFFAKAAELDNFFRLSIKNRLKKKLGMNYPKILRETGFGYVKQTLHAIPPVYIQGYFQSFKYLQGYEDLIRKIFSFPLGELDEVNLNILNELRSKTTISLHIRRGDYVEDQITKNFHGNCSTDYYLEAIAYLANEIGKNFSIFVFSDDHEWVKSQFQNLPYPKVFVDHNQGENCWKDLLLMSRCSHNVIANSSFSWWGAWLNQNPQKKVIAPRNWFSDSRINTDDLIPP